VGNERISSSDLEQVMALLQRDDVRQALQVAMATPVPVDRIKGLPLPNGLTHEQTIDLLTVIERVRGVYSPIPDEDGRLYWYVYTDRIRCALQGIDQHCTADSKLYDVIKSRAGARFLVQSNVEETVATALLDGVEIDADSAKDLLLMQRQPRSDAERLVVNHFRLAEQLEQLPDRPWTPETLLGLYARLVEGVSPEHTAPPADLLAWEVREGLMSGLCHHWSHVDMRQCEHPVVAAAIARSVISGLRLFPAWNGMMSRLVFRFVALKLGYPVLGYLPISQSELRVGQTRQKQLEPSARVDITDRWSEQNATPWLDVQVTLMAHALQQLRTRMERVSIIDEAVQAQLRADEGLNHRQRSIIGRALRIPDASFRIGYHRTTHSIGYATAHRDFTELVEHGYLTEKTEGRAKVFRIGPELEKRIGALDDVGHLTDYEVPLPPELLEDW